MYFFLNSGKTSALNVAQWLQVSEAYSTSFTLALGSPGVMSSPPVAVPASLEQPARASAPSAAMTRRRRLKFGMAASADSELGIKARFPPAGTVGTLQSQPVRRRSTPRPKLSNAAFRGPSGAPARLPASPPAAAASSGAEGRRAGFDPSAALGWRRGPWTIRSLFTA